MANNVEIFDHLNSTWFTFLILFYFPGRMAKVLFFYLVLSQSIQVQNHLLHKFIASFIIEHSFILALNWLIVYFQFFFWFAKLYNYHPNFAIFPQFFCIHSGRNMISTNYESSYQAAYLYYFFFWIITSLWIHPFFCINIMKN